VAKAGYLPHYKDTEQEARRLSERAA
jgi:hypothetical protein